MKKHIGILLLALMVVAVLLIYTVTYKLDFTQYGLIKRFGRTTQSLDGSKDAGLHFKWPWPIEKIVKYDARTYVFVDKYDEVITRDNRNVLVRLYCAWRIGDPVKFHSKIEFPDKAQKSIDALLRNYKKEVIPTYDMADLINTDPTAMLIPEMEEKIFVRVRKKALEDYGVEVVRVGIRNLGLPEIVSAAVIDAMKEERQGAAKEHDSQGDAKASAIKESAKAYGDQILAFARRKAQDIRSEGARAAAVYYSKFNENPGLSMFLRSLESLEIQLKGRVVFLMDEGQNPAIGFFRSGPSIMNVTVPAGGVVAPGEVAESSDARTSE